MKKKLLLVALVFTLGLAVSGCGHKEGTNIKAGFAAIDASDYNEAMKSFEQAIVSGEDLELSYRGEGITYLGMAQYDEAVTAFEKALDNAGIFAGDLECDINYYMATAYYKSAQYGEAEKFLEAVVKMQDKNSDAFYLLGTAELLQDDYESAVYHMEKAIELSEDSHATCIKVYEILAENGYEDKGREYLTDMLENEKNLTDYEQGVIHYYLEDYDQARNYLETAKQADKKGNPDIVSMLGQTYEKLGDSNYAGVLYAEYLADHPEHADMYNQLGLSKLHAQAYDEAVTAFETGLALNDASMTQTLKFNQIVAYEYSGNFDKAKSLMEKYLEAYPDDGAAQREYIFLKTR